MKFLLEGEVMVSQGSQSFLSDSWGYVEDLAVLQREMERHCSPVMRMYRCFCCDEDSSLSDSGIEEWAGL